jgi:hypothetical protein
MLVPGECKTPIGRVSSKVSFCLNGAALACFVQSGLKASCATLRWSAHLAAISSAPLGDPVCGSLHGGRVATEPKVRLGRKPKADGFAGRRFVHE